MILGNLAPVELFLAWWKAKAARVEREHAAALAVDRLRFCACRLLRWLSPIVLLDSVHGSEGVPAERGQDAAVLFSDLVVRGVREVEFAGLPGWRFFHRITKDPRPFGVAVPCL